MQKYGFFHTQGVVLRNFSTFVAMMEKRYNDFGAWLRLKLGFPVQKLSVDGGFTCPNRDGRVGVGGCTFCNNRAFTPAYVSGRQSIAEQTEPAAAKRRQSIAEQIEAGKRFFARKSKVGKYLAYFQTFSGTYAPLSILRTIYREALEQKDVVGLVVGTRPDCVSDEVLDELARLAQDHFVLVEYGVESTREDTLRRINRGHTFACAAEAIERTHRRGLLVGAHTILGLPGEDAEDALQQAETLSALPLDVLKLHQLQVVRGTVLADEYAKNAFPMPSAEDYVELVAAYLRHLRPSVVVGRFVSQSPKDMLVAPRWGLKNGEFTALLDRYLAAHNYRQGDLYAPSK